ncbi:hypothetical protein LXL04_020119 [Taraxacum kok-saghyz]
MDLRTFRLCFHESTSSETPTTSFPISSTVAQTLAGYAVVLSSSGVRDGGSGREIIAGDEGEACGVLAMNHNKQKDHSKQQHVLVYNVAFKCTIQKILKKSNLEIKKVIGQCMEAPYYHHLTRYGKEAIHDIFNGVFFAFYKKDRRIKKEKQNYLYNSTGTSSKSINKKNMIVDCSRDMTSIILDVIVDECRAIDPGLEIQLISSTLGEENPKFTTYDP